MGVITANGRHWNDKSHSSANIWGVKYEWLRTFYSGNVVHSHSYTWISSVPNYSTKTDVSLCSCTIDHKKTQRTHWQMTVFPQNEMTVHMYMIKLKKKCGRDCENLHHHSSVLYATTIKLLEIQIWHSKQTLPNRCYQQKTGGSRKWEMLFRFSGVQVKQIYIH